VGGEWYSAGLTRGKYFGVLALLSNCNSTAAMSRLIRQRISAEKRQEGSCGEFNFRIVGSVRIIWQILQHYALLIKEGNPLGAWKGSKQMIWAG
jgi:hypothetical protein